MFNLMQLLGKVKRDNTRFGSEQADIAGDMGVSVRNSPGWLSKGRPFTVGNSIFIPSNWGGGAGTTDWVVKEELPHVAQYRNEGLGGFALRHAKELLQHGLKEQVYQQTGTHEYDAHKDPKVKSELMSSLQPAKHEGILDFARSMFSGKPIDKLASTGKIDNVG